MGNKVDKDTAIEEINKWLDKIEYDEGHISEEDISNPTQEQAQRKITDDMLIKAVCDGSIVFDEDYQLILELKKPIKAADGTIMHDKLTFKTEVAVFEYNIAVKGIKPDDADKRMLATISAFTNVSKSRIDHLSTKSYRILQVIAGYLL